MPGEDAAAFRKLHDDLVDELRPNGAVEENIVEDLARLYWRKQNMATYQLAELARRRRSAIFKEKMDTAAALLSGSAEEVRGQRELADEQARGELGDDAWGLVEIGEIATVEYLLEDLAVAERLNGLIDRALKRLLFVRGIKSYTQTRSEGRSIEPPRPA